MVLKFEGAISDGEFESVDLNFWTMGLRIIIINTN